MIELINLCKSYTQESLEQKEMVVFDKLNISIPEGEFCAIIGKSGTGKSTLLNMLGLLDQSSSGDIKIDGELINNFNEEESAYFRNKKIGFVFQSYHLLPELSVLQNVALPYQLSGYNEREGNKEAEKLLRWVMTEEEIADKIMHKLPGQLSGGQSQRTAIARALINKPKIILADEPTGNLDKENSDSIFSKLLELNKEFNTTIVIITHDPTLPEKCSMILEVENKQLQAILSKQQYRKKLDEQKKENKNFAMQCPRCENDKLNETAIGDVIVDECSSCGGLWLDKGELGMIAYDNGEFLKCASSRCPNKIVLEK